MRRRRAAQWTGLSDPREGLRHWRRVRELAPGVEDVSERSELTLQACHQLLSLGWRMGGSEEEAAAVYEEGRALAERTGDRRALATLVGTYGAVRSFLGGSALDFVRYGEEAARIAAECDDPALRAAVGIFPTFGHFYVGDGRAMLEWSARVLEEVGSDNVLGKEIVGFSPRAGMLHVREQALMCLGRLEEAWSQVREAERVAEESRELEVLGWVHFAWAELAYTCGGTESVLEHGRRSLEIAEKLDNENSRVLAYFALGTAYLIDAQPAAAREALRESAAIARDRRTELAFLPHVLAVLAEAHLALGERTEALATAREGIDLGSAGGCRYYEAHAQLALAGALLATDGVVPRAEIESALERAELLVESIEGRSLSPRILEMGARLAGAGDRRMNCPRCGSQSPERAKFCLECGAAFASRCAGCGTELPPAAKFCLECGAKVVERATPSSAPRAYTPKHLADKILQSKSALEGERRRKGAFRGRSGESPCV